MKIGEKIKFKLLQQTYRYEKVGKKESKETGKKEDETPKEDLFDDVESFLDGLLNEKKSDKTMKKEE